MASHEIRRWKAESEAAYLYRILSDLESGTPRQLMFLELAENADQQAHLWAGEIRKNGAFPPPHFTPGLRLRWISWLLHRLGPRSLRPLLSLMKLQGLSVFTTDTPLPPSNPGEVPVISGEIRDAIFTAGDGVFFIGLMLMAMAGAVDYTPIILLTGIAGVMSGAICSAILEWWSSQAKWRAWERFRSISASEPPVATELRELSSIYRHRGLSSENAIAEARRNLSNDELLPEEISTAVVAEVELPPPWQAATHAFFAFVSGGLIPLLPYLLDIRRHPLLIAALLTLSCLFLTGLAKAYFRGQVALWGGLRFAATGLGCGSLAYLLGQQLGEWLL